MAVEYLVRNTTNGEHTPNLIGTPSAPVTLTAAYSGNIVSFVAGNLKVIILYVFYVPAQSSRTLYVQVEGSANNSNWAKKIIFLETDTSGESTMLGHIAKLEGTTGGETYSARYVITVADPFVRIAVKESGAANFGTAFVQAAGEFNTM